MSTQSHTAERWWRLPPLWMLLLLGAAVVLHKFAGNPWPLPFSRAVSLLLFIPAAVLAAWAFICFRRDHTPWEPTAEPCALIADGPFRFSRNPAYLSLLLLLIGASLWMRDPLTLLAALAYFVITDVVQIRYEERKLRAQFGAAFERYCRRTRRWI